MRRQSREMNETKLELKQPFSSFLSQLSLHTLSRDSEKGRRGFRQVAGHLQVRAADLTARRSSEVTAVVLHCVFPLNSTCIWV